MSNATVRPGRGFFIVWQCMQSPSPPPLQCSSLSFLRLPILQPVPAPHLSPQQLSIEWRSFPGSNPFPHSYQLHPGLDSAEDIAGGLKLATELKWKGDIRLCILLADAPCHGIAYHTGVWDRYPDGCPEGKDPCKLLYELQVCACGAVRRGGGSYFNIESICAQAAAGFCAQAAAGSDASVVLSFIVDAASVSAAL